MEQAAAYAGSLNLNLIKLATFVPVDDEAFSGQTVGENRNCCVAITVVTIGWI
jgi:hypothetical protein